MKELQSSLCSTRCYEHGAEMGSKGLEGNHTATRVTRAGLAEQVMAQAYSGERREKTSWLSGHSELKDQQHHDPQDPQEG